MKSFKFYLIKFVGSFLVFSSLILLNVIDLRSQRSGNCNESQACSGWFTCSCGDSDCLGCFIANGQGGCGICRSR